MGELARLVARLPNGVPHAPLAIPVVLPQLLLLARARCRLCRALGFMGKHTSACTACIMMSELPDGMALGVHRR